MPLPTAAQIDHAAAESPLSREIREATAMARRLRKSHDDLLAALKLATAELNAIRARDGVPQHIVWDRGKPIQTESCTHEAWDALTERCFAAIAHAETV